MKYKPSTCYRDIRRKSSNLQLLLFSATFNDEVKEFAGTLLKDTKFNEVRESKHATIAHVCIAGHVYNWL